MHGDYHFDKERGIDCVELLPFGPPGLFSIRIDVPKSDAECRLRIRSRCLLSLDYPEDKSGLGGKVTLAGTIGVNGKVRSLRIVGAESHSRLIQEALENLRSWRFEPAAQSDSFEIVYSYQNQACSASNETSALQFDLPRSVTICSSPPASSH